MTSLGYVCDECGDEYPDREPAAVVRKDGDWVDLCADCYDDECENYRDEPREDEQAVYNARSLLEGYSEYSDEEKDGTLMHAINELRIARRSLDDY